MIKYTVKAKKDPKTSAVKYYPQIYKVDHLTADDVAEQIAYATTVTKPDAKAVISALEYVVLTAAKNNQSIRLGDLGSFRPTISADGSEDASDATTDKIKSVRIRFTQGAYLRKELKPASLSFQLFKA